MNINRMKAAILAGFLLLLPLQAPADKPAQVAMENYQRGVAAFEAGKFSQARELWLPLAESGEVQSQYAIGRLYEKGKGVERDFSRAFSWYRKAAEKNHADSQYRLAVGYAYGLGIAKNESEALSWLQKAANNGQKRAQKVLAQAYEEGRWGLKPNPKQAKYWYDKANSGL